MVVVLVVNSPVVGGMVIRENSRHKCKMLCSVLQSVYSLETDGRSGCPSPPGTELELILGPS